MEQLSSVSVSGLTFLTCLSVSGGLQEGGCGHPGQEDPAGGAAVSAAAGCSAGSAGLSATAGTQIQLR